MSLAIPENASVVTAIIASGWKIAAGACGSIIPIYFQTDLTNKQKVAYAVSGASVAVFLGPVISDRFFGGDAHLEAATAFVCGLVGMKVCEVFIRWINNRGEATLDKVADRVLGERDRDHDSHD